MIRQSLDFIDSQIVGSSYIYSPGTSTRSEITESKTYPYVIYKGGTPVFYGNKFIEAGTGSSTGTNPTVYMNITDFVRFNVQHHDYSTLNSLTLQQYNESDIIDVIDWNIYSGGTVFTNATKIAGDTTTVASIYRYPNGGGSDFMVGDPGVTQATGTTFSSLIQGCVMDNATRGKIGAVSGYKLLPRFPRYKHTNTSENTAYVYLGLQTSYVSGDTISVGLLQDSQKYSVGVGNITNIPTGVTSGYLRIKTYNASCQGIGLIQQSANPQTGFDAYEKCQRVCDIDYEPVGRYYLMWQDRFGGYQCQPFCKTHTFSEGVETSEVKDSANNRRIVQVNTQPKWKLNSKWVDAELFPIYESIFVSPLLVVIDTEEGVEHNVILTDKEYTEKTFKNQGRKLFNIELNFEESTQQQITY